jgi:hypothetical protein
MNLAIEVIEESASVLSVYEKVPFAFRVESHFLIVLVDNGWRFEIHRNSS